jgi:hypothetical protein
MDILFSQIMRVQNLLLLLAKTCSYENIKNYLSFRNEMLTLYFYHSF